MDRRITVSLKSIMGLALSSAVPFAGVAATQAEDGDARRPGQQIVRSGTQAAVAGARETFTGQVRVDPLFAATEHSATSGAYVSFEPGARSAWHTHPAGQRLVVVSGVGLTQEWGKPVQEIHPGDVIDCPPGVKHWHGASPGMGMTHLAITGVVDGRSVQWMEKVTDPIPQAASPALSGRQTAIVLASAAMATSSMPALRAALNGGLDAGLSVAEAREVLVQLYAYVGFPRALNALGVLKTVVDERRALGLADDPGREPARRIPPDADLLAIGKANQTRIAGAPVQGPVFDFAPVINQFLQAHLFGAIFERDNLDWQSRELATVGALAATPGVQAQLRSHMGASLRVGLTRAQLAQVVQTLRAAGYLDAAQRAGTALDQAVAAQATQP